MGVVASTIDNTPALRRQGESPARLPGKMRLRSDLVWHQRGDAGSAVLEDPVSGQFYRLGLMEQLFVEQLADDKTPEEATNNLVHFFTDQQWDTARSMKLCLWLQRHGLVEGTVSTQAGQNAKKLQIASAYFLKIPLFNPDALLGQVNRTVGWLFDWKATVTGTAFFVVSLLWFLATAAWTTAAVNLEGIFAPHRFLWLTGSWMVLKILHELGHGATCKRYGCEVKQCGVMSILLIPIAYVDVTSSWRLNRWKRLHITMAGVATELFFAGCGLLVWSMADSVVVQQAAMDVVLLASVSSILFNLNPLLKFDGYYALADATGIDNLFELGQQYARHFGARYVLGLCGNPPSLPKRHAIWIRVYGVAAACYRTITVTSLVVAAAAIFHGAGIVLAVVGAILFLVVPLAKLVVYLADLHRDGNLMLGKLIARLSAICSLIGAALFLVPANGTFTAPAIVQYSPPGVLRAPVSGFVDAIHVRDGEVVQSGQAILSLRNDELQTEWLRLQKEVLTAEQEVRSSRFRREASDMTGAEANLDGLRKQLAELEANREDLVVRAPSDGVLVSRNLRLLQDRYVDEGQELGEVGIESSKRLKVSIAPTDAHKIAGCGPREIAVTVPNYGRFVAKLDHLESRTSQTIPDDSLSSINGGRLTVADLGDNELQLIDPRTSGYINLDKTHSLSLRAGQRAYVTLDTNRQSIAQWLLHKWRTWVQ